MATNDHSTNRRNVIAAMAASALAVPALAQGIGPDASTWERALADFRRTKAAQDGYSLRVIAPLTRTYEAIPRGGAEASACFAEICEAERGFDRLSDRTWEAVKTLWQTPAPTLAALAIKLEIADAEELHECGEDQRDATRAMLADVRRLASEG